MSKLSHKKEMILIQMKNKPIKKRKLNTHKGACKLSNIYFFLMNIEIISDDKWTQKTKPYLYCCMNKITGSHIMPTCQVKASSNFPLPSTLYSYTADILSMEQICSHSVASSFKISPIKQHATDIHAVLFWDFTWWGRFCTKNPHVFIGIKNSPPKFRPEPVKCNVIYASFKEVAQEADNLFRILHPYMQFSYHLKTNIYFFLTSEENWLKASVFHASTLF